MPGPVRSGIGAAASWIPGAIGLSVAGAVLQSAGFGGTVLLARCQSRDAGAGSSLLQRILEARGGSFLHFGEWQSVSLGNPRFFLVLLRRRHGRPARGGGRIVSPEHDVNHGAFQVVDMCVRGG